MSDRTQPFSLVPYYRQLQLLLDLLALAGSFLLAYLLRFEFAIPPSQVHNMFVQMPYVVLLQLLAVFLVGIYSFIWRYVGLKEIGAFGRAGLLSAIPLLALRYGLPDALAAWRVPLSVIVLDTCFAFGGLLGLRVLRRIYYERDRRRALASSRESARQDRATLLVGADEAGVATLKEVQSRGDMAMDVRGFVDDDPGKQGMLIQGVKVLGTTRDIESLVAEHDIEQIVITLVEASRAEIRRIVERSERADVEVKIVPGLFEILEGRVAISRFRDVEIEDLLGREPVFLEGSGLKRLIEGRRVMVTGAGGSIGSELARQVAAHAPERLLLVERAEPLLFSIHRELENLLPAERLVPLVADASTVDRMEKIFAEHRPQVVLHAAAHKHVPLMESNVAEAVENNVLGTHRLGQLAASHGSEVFVLVSTDKAVRPTSVMGATKRLAELVIQRLDGLTDTHFVAVRFGNVLGSTGSVIPIFREQISRGGPVTVTHPKMTRYFMTVPEAARLVLEAGSMGTGGEIFILDMGEPVKILDLAEDMVTLSGFRPYEEMDIVFTGLRPGEKLVEELELTGEKIAKTRHPKIFIGRLAPYPPAEVEQFLEVLGSLTREGRHEELRQTLGDLLPEASLGSPPGEPVAGGPAAAS